MWSRSPSFVAVLGRPLIIVVAASLAAGCRRTAPDGSLYPPKIGRLRAASPPQAAGPKESGGAGLQVRSTDPKCQDLVLPVETAEPVLAALQGLVAVQCEASASSPELRRPPRPSALETKVNSGPVAHHQRLDLVWHRYRTRGE